jgi:hypothetical protein
MTRRQADDTGPPRPEQLTAYVDGELAAADRARVEAWLARHPAAAADVRAQRHLARLWKATAPAEPSEADWDALLARIEAALPARPADRLLGYRLAGGLGAAAAAVVLALALSRPPRPQPPVEPKPVVPFPVVSADEVEIISVDGADALALVIGKPPVREPLVLAAARDVTLQSVEEGMFTHVPADEGPDAPMFVVPVDMRPTAEPGGPNP